MTSGYNALLRDDDNRLVTQAVLYPAAYTLTRDKPKPWSSWPRP
ncbi:hypothetical protein [Streptomyces atroolivaceus]